MCVNCLNTKDMNEGLFCQRGKNLRNGKCRLPVETEQEESESLALESGDILPHSSSPSLFPPSRLLVGICNLKSPREILRTYTHFYFFCCCHVPQWNAACSGLKVQTWGLLISRLFLVPLWEMIPFKQVGPFGKQRTIRKVHWQVLQLERIAVWIKFNLLSKHCIQSVLATSGTWPHIQY